MRPAPDWTGAEINIVSRVFLNRNILEEVAPFGPTVTIWPSPGVLPGALPGVVPGVLPGDGTETFFLAGFQAGRNKSSSELIFHTSEEPRRLGPFLRS